MGLRELLARHRRLAADTMVFIYYLEDHPRYAPSPPTPLPSPGGGEGRWGDRATAFLTNDARLKAVRELEVALLDELGGP